MTDTFDPTTTALLQARRDRRPVAAPAPAGAPADAAAAYAVQARVAQALGWTASTHWKSGGATLATQTHAQLPPAGVQPSPADLGGWPFQFRGIEAEVALRLARPVDAALAATLDADGARALVDAMAVTIEIVDSRWIDGRNAPATAKLADLQSHGALVVGAWLPFEARRDWAAQRCEVLIGQRAPLVFTGTHSLGDPVAVLPNWLRHATQGGVVLPAGSVVTTGTWCGLPIAEPGESVLARFDGIGEVRVQL